jgi:hypothetical protein
LSVDQRNEIENTVLAILVAAALILAIGGSVAAMVWLIWRDLF